MNKTIYDKIFESHVIKKYNNLYILYIDKILLHEVTSPQAFMSIGKKILWNKSSIFSTSDHNVSTNFKHRFFYNKNLKQLKCLKKNFKKFFFKYYDINSPKQGIIHIIASESKILLPGMIAICGDSHTTTNGALSLIANGIGTTDIEIGISTQCIIQKKLKNMKIVINNFLNKNVTSKDLILFIIKKITSKGGTGYSIEFKGDCIKSLSISEKMTLCNMSIEAGSKISIISPDVKTINFYKKKIKNIKKFINYLKQIKSNKKSFYDKTFYYNAKNIYPHITWGSNLDTIIELDELVHSDNFKMLKYMNLKSNNSLYKIKIDKVFIGSCTNSRFEDLLVCSKLLLKLNKKKHKNVIAYVVSGSENIRLKCEFYGIDKIFKKYDFIWKNSGCSMCLAMNEDKLKPGERCVSTSNRNFVGRQGYKSITHLSSPIFAVISAIYGEFINFKLYNLITNDFDF
ncbi:3-isopropylmalate dehydratase large subunit [Candidatus Carsonella ruddii PV]|uniref:3-isopropylmalate dehydratase n=1 Tax=Carsonella ruddii (strain PV) TaxID=387662 RepID=Q05FR0_CARRP|nr:aconitase family protein [Candidatus Carsonella ruddii]BAF35111.1 3-isopropylmalate dehydratase large subunit [Candidatus Carsonella ruddii PV]